MKMKNLKNILYGIGLAGSVLLVSGETGCETMNSADQGSVVLGVLANGPQMNGEKCRQQIRRYRPRTLCHLLCAPSR